MKKHILVLLILFAPHLLMAQKVSIKKGIAYIDDSAFCKVTGRTGILGSMETSFSILNLTDKELIFINEKNVTDKYYEFSFLDANEKFKISKADFEPNWKPSIVKTLFSNKVVIDSAINEKGKNAFLLKYKYEIADDGDNTIINKSNSESGGETKLIDRNTDAEIFVFGEEIQQDFKTIGKFSHSTNTDANANIIRTYIIKLPTGERIAEFKVQEFNQENNSLYIYKNDKTLTVYDLDGSIGGQESATLKKVVALLIRNRSI